MGLSYPLLQSYLVLLYFEPFYTTHCQLSSIEFIKLPRLAQSTHILLLFKLLLNNEFPKN